MANTDKSMIRQMVESDLEYVLTWRNHPSIRDYMLTQHEITAKEHRLWFNRASADSDRRLLILDDSSVSLG